MPDYYYDCDLSTAKQHGAEALSQAFEQDPTSLIRTSTWRQLTEDLTPLTLGADHPTESDFYLTGEFGHRPLPGQITEWQREYAKVPAGRDEWETFAYQFIGLSGVWGATTEPTGRNRFTRVVPCKVSYAYFIVTGDPADTGPTAYETVADIPLITEQEYYFGTADYPTNWLADYPTWTSSSTPSKSTYLGWVTAGTYICCEGSDLRRWRGPIFERVTKYVKAL